MNKVEAYRCEECEGKGLFNISENYVDRDNPSRMECVCPRCKGTGIVWLTEEEARDRELIADHESNAIKCCGTGCGEGCVG